MPRRNRPARAVPGAPRALSGALGWTRTEHADDGEWVVRGVPGAQGRKTYRCPGCDHEIPAGVGHLVAWPAGDAEAADDRRHWHTACWLARQRRRPASRRAR